MPEKSLKKKLLLAGNVHTPRMRAAVLELSVGTRPFLGEWLEKLGGPECAGAPWRGHVGRGIMRQA